MPRVADRRPLTGNNNNVDDEDAPKRKIMRPSYTLSLPKRSVVVGRVLVCGQGSTGQLGLGPDVMERRRPALLDVTNIVDISAGGMHSLLLTDDGRVYSFGCNDEGALGRDTSSDDAEFEVSEIALPGKALKMSAGDSHSACLLDDGRVFAWGSFRDSHGNMGLTLEGNKRLPINILPGIVCCDIASGSDHLAILSAAGKVYTVGCAEQGQLGRVALRSMSGEGRRGKTDLLQPGEVRVAKRCKPFESIWATNYCTFMRESHTGTMWAFGLNNYKQLTHAPDTQIVIKPIATKIEKAKQLAGGQHHTMMLNDSGVCYVVGRCDYGRLGLGAVSQDIGELQPIQTLNDKKVVYITCGEATSFALSEDGKVYSWGMGSNCQLGLGTDEDAFEPVLVESKETLGKRVIGVSSGGQHSLFLVEGEDQPSVKLTPPVLLKKQPVKLIKPKKVAATSTTNSVVPQPAVKMNESADAAEENPIDESSENTDPTPTTDDDADKPKKDNDNDSNEPDTSSGLPAKRGRKKK